MAFPSEYVQQRIIAQISENLQVSEVEVFSSLKDYLQEVYTKDPVSAAKIALGLVKNYGSNFEQIAPYLAEDGIMDAQEQYANKLLGITANRPPVLTAFDYQRLRAAEVEQQEQALRRTFEDQLAQSEALQAEVIKIDAEIENHQSDTAVLNVEASEINQDIENLNKEYQEVRNILDGAEPREQAIIISVGSRIEELNIQAGFLQERKDNHNDKRKKHEETGAGLVARKNDLIAKIAALTSEEPDDPRRTAEQQLRRLT